MNKLYQSKFTYIRLALKGVLTYLFLISMSIGQAFAMGGSGNSGGFTGGGSGGVQTANLGSSFNISTFVGIFYRIALPIAVVLGLIFIAKAGYAIMFSEGDPRRVSEGKEDLTSAIMGLLFVMLSVAILRVIMGQLIIGGSAGF